MRDSTALHVSETGVWLGTEMQMNIENRVRPDGDRLGSDPANDSGGQSFEKQSRCMKRAVYQLAISACQQRFRIPPNFSSAQLGCLPQLSR